MTVRFTILTIELFGGVIILFNCSCYFYTVLNCRSHHCCPMTLHLNYDYSNIHVRNLCLCYEGVDEMHPLLKGFWIFKSINE